MNDDHLHLPMRPGPASRPAHRFHDLLARLFGLVEVEALGLVSRTIPRLLRLDLDPTQRTRVAILQLECDAQSGRWAEVRAGLESLQSLTNLSAAEATKLEILGARYLAVNGPAAVAFRKVVPILRRTHTFEEERALAEAVAALALYRAGHYSWAEGAFLSSAAYFRLAKRPARLARILSDLALVTKSQGKIEVALQHLDEAERLLRARPRSPARVRLLIHKGICRHRIGDLAEARAAFEEARAMANSIRLHQGIAATSNNLGHVARTEGDLAGAERLYSQALELWRAEGVEGPSAYRCSSLAKSTRALAGTPVSHRGRVVLAPSHPPEAKWPQLGAGS